MICADEWRSEANAGCWWGRLREGNPLEDLGVDGSQEVGWWGAWTDFIWLRVGTGGGALVNAAMNLRFP